MVRNFMAFLIAASVACHGAAAQEQMPRNLLNLASGGVLVSAEVNPLPALALTDGDPKSAWNTSTKKAPPPYRFVIELQAPASLSHVGIDGAGARPGGVVGGSAKAVTVEASATGPEAGFAPLARFDAAEEGRTMVPVEPGAPVRWLRYSIEGAHTPEAPFLYFNAVVAYGDMAVVTNESRFDGVFQNGRKDLLELHQNGASITGCYTENSGRTHGTLTGDVVDGVALLSWTSDKDITGTALLTRESRGGIAGVRYRQKSRSPWGGPAAEEGARTPCSPEPAAAQAQEPEVDPIIQALVELGEVRLYGIHFEHDSDVPKPSATPALERLLAALQSAPDLSVEIEGHTDGDGDDAYNLDLSDRRAATVVAWLTTRGIAAGRMTPVGKGEAEPVASNSTADGKALNRRVEVRRK